MRAAIGLVFLCARKAVLSLLRLTSKRLSRAFCRSRCRSRSTCHRAAPLAMTLDLDRDE
jgi:hypothetical protein